MANPRPVLQFDGDGKPIVNMDFIKSRPLSYSSLKQFRKSPKHYIQYLQKKFVQNDAMIIGSAIDCKALEPEKFDSKFMIYEPFKKQSNDAKLKWKMMCEGAALNGQTLISKEQMINVGFAVESLMSHDVALKLIEGKKKVQKKLRWMDRKTKLPFVGYVDLETEAWGEDFAVDLKSTRDGDPNQFIRDAFKLDYQIQAGCYLEGYKRQEFRFPNFAFLTVENCEPFNVTMMYADSKFCNQAREEFLGSVVAFKKCMDENRWSEGYDFRLHDGMEYFSIHYPGYYKPKFISFNEDE